MDVENRNFDIRWFDTLESTNNYCKLLDINSVEEFTVVCARRQTAGIGQQGNVWVSEPDKNLTFSLILKPTFINAADQYNLTMALALAVAETLEQQLSAPHSPLSAFRFPLSAQIKWPNDIYVGDRKVCGILTTNHLSDGHISSSICGIGLNVNQTVFPDWVSNPTSLLLESPSGQNPFDLNAVLSALLDNILRRYSQLRQPSAFGTLRADYLRRLYRLGVEADYIHDGQPLRATITGIDRYGHLQLTTASGTSLSCAMKEIKFLI